ncbi:hypothetical protein SEA_WILLIAMSTRONG_62 [Microbacterium phage WilliamStrong]|nr:hypothetical protein SEA_WILLIAMSTRONG_62 [Microbacterium phage WilliamStrong]
MNEAQEPVHQPVAARNIEVSVSQPKVKQSRDRAQYVRQQKGHSFLLHWLVLGIFTVFIVPIYYSFSPNHYWHL